MVGYRRAGGAGDWRGGVVAGVSGLIYLASPYSHPSPGVMQARFEAICRVSARLMSAGWHLYSPIAHTHPIALAGDLPRGWDYWRQYDEKILKACSELWICKLDGYEKSKGIAGEFEIATGLGLRVRYIEEDEIPGVDA